MKQILRFLLFLLAQSCLGQPSAKQFVIENTRPIASLNSNNNDYSDLEGIEKAIGNKRIVMLGELYHGDATTFSAKTRLIKFLHEKLGFNVLVFESDFFSLNNGWEKLQKNAISFDSLVYLSIYPIWTQCSQFQPLLSYISEQIGTENELSVSGMDNRGYSGYGLRYLYKEIDSFLKATNIPFIKDAQSSSEYFKLLKQAPALINGRSKQDLNRLSNYTGVILEQLRMQSLKDSFYIKVLQGHLQQFNMALYYRYDSVYTKTKKNYFLHDFQMAENLKWLVSCKYPNQKIIVWAHNTHVEKASAENTEHNDYNSMGFYFTKDSSLFNQTYIIGFTAYAGNGRLMLGDNADEKVTKPNNYSIETWMHKKGYPYSFVDFTGFNSSPCNKEPFYMKSYINKEERLEWNMYYDGIFFIDKMMPCETKRQ